MSLVVFPFKQEHPDVVVGNIQIAAAHPRVSQVLCVGFEIESTYEAIAGAAPKITHETGTTVDLILQDRVGTRRPGKGDGMNTALRYFLDDTAEDRIHFYDSDITSFGPDWITKAEEAADFEYGVVRHYFPRPSTDAMITWMITRVAFALLWPRSELPWIEQPLGGELLFKRYVVEHLVEDKRVQDRSDWGIDTLFTFSVIQEGFPIYETYMPEGKAHKLYGRLTDIREMLVEVFVAVQELANEEVDGGVVHRIEYPDVVPHSIAEKIGFDLEATMSLLLEGWTEGQKELLEFFPVPVRDGMLANLEQPTFGFMEESNWYDTIEILLADFEEGNDDWEELLFKLWTTRVLQYTSTSAARGFSYTQRYLHGMIGRYMRRAALGS